MKHQTMASAPALMTLDAVSMADLETSSLSHLDIQKLRILQTQSQKELAMFEQGKARLDRFASKSKYRLLQLQALISPIRYLPDETLEQIFEFYCFEYKPDWSIDSRTEIFSNTIVGESPAGLRSDEYVTSDHSTRDIFSPKGPPTTRVPAMTLSAVCSR